MLRIKKIIAALSASAIAASSIAVTSIYTSASDDVPDTAYEVVAQMGNGINLGNTLESCDQSCIGKTKYASTVNGYETLWGAPTTTKEMIQGMKEAGYNTVRIPIAWSNLMSDNGVVEEGNTYTINEDLMDRVEEIVNWVLDADMYCIINCHWDGGWWPQLAATNSDKTADEETRAEALKKYKAIWTQVGERFKDYSNKLIFESANEELGDDFTDTDFGYKPKTSERYEITNMVNQTFVDLIRSQGGNNAERYLLIAGYDTDIEETTDDRFVMPTDTIENHLMISVHYYNPSTYCLVSDPDNSWGYSDTWGTESDIATMKALLEKMLEFSEQGYGVVIGEYGAFKGENNTIKEGTYLWYETLIETCEELNYCPIAWETSNSSNNYGDWYNRKECKIVDETMAAIYKDNSEIVEPTSYVPTTEEDPLAYLYNTSTKDPESTTLASGTADSTMAGAVSVKITFDCAEDVSFNQWASINVLNTIGSNDTVNTSITGNNEIAGAKSLSATAGLSAAICEGDSYNISAYTTSWGGAEDYVYAVRKVEFLDADGNVLKTIENDGTADATTDSETTTEENNPTTESETTTEENNPTTESETTSTKAETTTANTAATESEATTDSETTTASSTATASSTTTASTTSTTATATTAATTASTTAASSNTTASADSSNVNTGAGSAIGASFALVLGAAAIAVYKRKR